MSSICFPNVLYRPSRSSTTRVWSSIYTRPWMLSYVTELPSRSHLTLLSKTLVRLGAYQALDLTISEALTQRSPDFPGVVICTAGDSLGTLLQLIKKRRVHRLVVVEGEVRYLSTPPVSESLTFCRKKRRRVARRAVYLALSPSATCCDTSLVRLELELAGQQNRSRSYHRLPRNPAWRATILLSSLFCTACVLLV